MTLKFDRTKEGDISICVYDGTVSHPFSYTELIKKLMDKEIIETDYSDVIKSDEKDQIEQLISEIRRIVNPDTKIDEPNLFNA